MKLNQNESNVCTLTDEQLARHCAAGDGRGLDELFRRHREVAYRVAYRLLGNESDALDAVQDGFVNALTNLDRFRGGCAFKTWLLKIVSNSALDLGRRRRRRDSRSTAVSEDIPFEMNGAHPHSDLERADLRRQLDRALASLPEAHRLTFILHADGDLSYREVAKALGISIGTVMSRIFYARKQLRILLADLVMP